jgi:hypothetical protein
MTPDIPSLGWLADDMDEQDALTRRVLDLHEREVQNAWASLLSTESGRMVAWTILDHCHVFSTTYTGNAASNFLEGERSVGLKILKGQILPNGPHLLADMMVEADDRHDRLLAQAMAEIDGEQDD